MFIFLVRFLWLFLIIKCIVDLVYFLCLRSVLQSNMAIAKAVHSSNMKSSGATETKNRRWRSEERKDIWTCESYLHQLLGLILLEAIGWWFKGIPILWKQREEKEKKKLYQQQNQNLGDSLVLNACFSMSAWVITSVGDIKHPYIYEYITRHCRPLP